MRYLICVCLMLVLVSQAAGLDVEHRLLPNGLQVYVAENHNAPVFTMRAYVKAGSIYEDEYLGHGISHFCEHLVSGGTTHKRPEADTEQILRAIGGASNAYTTSDHTCYYISTSVTYMDSVIDLISDWVLNCAITEEEYNRERGVILREITMGMDEPGRRIGKLYNGSMFVEHPEHFPTIGYKELFERITHDDLVKYYERMYVPANIHVVAVGDFDVQEVLGKIDAAFSEYPYEPPPSIYLPTDPKQMGMRHVEDDMDVDLTYMTLGFRTVMIGHEDVYPLHVLARILGDGRSSRLYSKVKDELGLVHTINTSSYNPEYDAADFTVHVTCDYDRAAEAREAILDVIYGLKKTHVTRPEIEKAKTQILSDEAFGFQDIQDQAATIGVDVLRSGNPDYTEYYLRRIREVTRDDIRRVVDKYFCDDALTIAVLKPTGAIIAQAQGEKESVETSDVTKMVLENGITLLLKEDRNVPLVHMRAYFRGGSSLETEANNGAFNLMARMLRRGTRRRSAEAIAKEVDAMGGQLYSSSGEDFFSCNMDVLSENFDSGLTLLADLIINSAFGPDQVEKERQTVLSFIKQRNDDWQQDAEVRMRRVLYGGHPYGLDPMGEEISVEGISRDELYDLYTDYCAPGNMVLAVFGDVDRADAEMAVTKAFRRFSREARAVPAPEAWAGLGEDIMKIEPTEKQQAVIFMGYPGMDAGSPDWYAMRVLDAVVSGIGYPGGWLHKTLRGQQLVYIVHAWNYVLQGKGYFVVMAATQPATADSALDIIREKIEKVKTDYVTDEELEMGKRICGIMEDLYYSQTTSSQANIAAQYETIGLGYDHRARLKERIDTVTREDVREVARKYLNESATVLIRPDEAYETSMR
jgi:zinc protease